MRPVITDLVAVHGQRPCPYTSNVHGKNTYKSKPPNKIKKKWSPTTKKWKNKQKGNKNERKTEAKRTKAPTQSEQKPRLKTRSELRTQSELRAQSSEQKKRGVPPLKKYTRRFVK